MFLALVAIIAVHVDKRLLAGHEHEHEHEQEHEHEHESWFCSLRI
jgi:hypothetical protein